ncbi:hypothetical protein MTR67_039586 [Solanum verrucosum]|uniref:Uncharacterized protein n=1 Tax=Solanum verrucosum TaxID=315347 RepID=A0AAF0ZP06_SOLVR|nr:hypothetical protein MTR67_039586 [Solanum verrucosum]
MFICLKGVTWIKPGSIAWVFSSWNKDINVAEKEEGWKNLLTCIWWTIWAERNKRFFEKVQNSLTKIKMNYLIHFIFWCKHDVLAQIHDIFDVLHCL